MPIAIALAKRTREGPQINVLPSSRRQLLVAFARADRCARISKNWRTNALGQCVALRLCDARWRERERGGRVPAARGVRSDGTRAPPAPSSIFELLQNVAYA